MSDAQTAAVRDTDGHHAALDLVASSSADAAATPAPRHLTAVPPIAEPRHDHTWSLREVEFGDSGAGVHRFECECGDVSYS